MGFARVYAVVSAKGMFDHIVVREVEGGDKFLNIEVVGLKGGDLFI